MSQNPQPSATDLATEICKTSEIKQTQYEGQEHAKERRLNQGRDVRSCASGEYNIVSYSLLVWYTALPRRDRPSDKTQHTFPQCQTNLI